MVQVSVVIPNYNHALYLQQRVDSVLGQTFQDIEVIILDDHSTDNSRDIIEEYRNHAHVTQIVYNETNSGSTFSQWQKGVALCSAEIIWIAESDDFADKNFLSILVPQMQANERLGIAYCQSLSVNDQNQITGSWKSQTDDLNSAIFDNDFTMAGAVYVQNFLIHKNTIPNASAVVFRKKFYQKAGGVETSVKNCGDWITWLRILLFSDVFYSAQALNNFRYHDKSVIAQATRNFDHTRYIEKYDRTMRAKFQDYLERKHIEKTGILSVNNRYIEKENVEQSLFELP